jgi:SAM-dependent methyltransferase
MINQFTFDDATLRAFIEHSVKGERLSPWHITRYAMYRDLGNVLAAHDVPGKLAASISHSQQLAYVTGVRQPRFVDMNYPEFNVLDLPFEDNTFDFAFADMVFEHIEGNPWEAYSEISRILKPGGMMVLTTVFAFPYHPCPGDFWRYTESGLRMLATKNGHEVIKAGCWGNLQTFILDRLGCADIKIPENPDHPLHKLATTTDPKWPTTVWLVARKP